MNGKLYGVSIGPGDPGLVTIRAASCLNSCKAIVFPVTRIGSESVAMEIATRAVEGLREKECVELLFPMSSDPCILEQAWGNAADTVCELLLQGKDVAFPVLGDVSIYSTYSHIHNDVKSKGFTCEMIAGVPSFCAAAALLGEELTETKQPLHIIPASIEDIGNALEWPGVKVVMKVGKSFARLKEELRARGMEQNARMVSRCGLPGERIISLDEVTEQNFEYFSMIIIK